MVFCGFNKNTDKRNYVAVCSYLSETFVQDFRRLKTSVCPIKYIYVTLQSSINRVSYAEIVNKMS